MATVNDSSLTFFSKATAEQWTFVLSQYKEVFRIHAQETRGSRKNGPAELIKLDTWYQEQLPSLIRARKDHQLVYEDLVQVTKWKLLRGKFRPSLLDLVKTNTETAVKNVTKKAFKKMPNIASAISALTTLKGIGPATASAILVAYSPDVCPYMADENMLSTPGVEVTDYTSAEYLNYVQQLNVCVDRLKKLDPQGDWTPHKVELALWTHYQMKQYNCPQLEQMPMPKTAPLNGNDDEDEHQPEESNGADDSSNEGSGDEVIEHIHNVSANVSNGHHHNHLSDESNGADSNGVQSNGIGSNGIDSEDQSMNGADSNGVESNGVESNGIESNDADESNGASNGVDSNGVIEPFESNESSVVSNGMVESNGIASHELTSELTSDHVQTSNLVETNEAETNAATMTGLCSEQKSSSQEAIAQSDPQLIESAVPNEDAVDGEPHTNGQIAEETPDSLAERPAKGVLLNGESISNECSQPIPDEKSCDSFKEQQDPINSVTSSDNVVESSKRKEFDMDSETEQLPKRVKVQE